MGPRTGLDGYGKLHPHRDSILDRPARSELLYRLRYPGLKDITPKPEIRFEIYFQRFQKYLLCAVSRAGGPQEVVTILTLSHKYSTMTAILL